MQKVILHLSHLDRDWQYLRCAGVELMPSAMAVAAYQMNDANLRHAAKTFKARSPIFLTQATEAEKAAADVQQRKWSMKKRLNDMLQPPPAVLSHALSPAKLYRSLSQAKRNSGKVKRRTKVGCFCHGVLLQWCTRNALQWCIRNL